MTTKGTKSETELIEPALADGLIEMTIPEKANSRLQKYRVTTAGQARLAQSSGGRK